MPNFIAKYNDEYVNINCVLSSSTWISYRQELSYYHYVNAELNGVLIFLTSFG